MAKSSPTGFCHIYSAVSYLVHDPNRTDQSLSSVGHLQHSAPLNVGLHHIAYAENLTAVWVAVVTASFRLIFSSFLGIPLEQSFDHCLECFAYLSAQYHCVQNRLITSETPDNDRHWLLGFHSF
jgi:hypothetical protein